jgi:hypothetical protein
MRPSYHLAPSLTQEDRQQLGRVARSLTLLADVSRADLMLFARADDDSAIVLGHAQPRPVPSLHSASLVGKQFDSRKAPQVHRLLTQGGGRSTVHQALVRGAPSVQELFTLRRPSGEVLAVVQSEMALMEHGRQRKRSPVLRRGS